MCKLADIFVTKIGLFGLLYLTNFRPCKIGKSWIASGIRPRNDIKPFRPNVSLKGTGYALGSLVQPTKLRVLILTSLNKKNTLSGILLKKRRRWDSNPRNACTFDSFQDCSDQPLWHSSKTIFLRVLLFYALNLFCQ